MRAVIQRVKEASVKVQGKVTGEISQGLLVLVGIEDADTQEDIEWLSKKIAGLRIFDDENGVMNRSVMEVDGQILAVSQFTLMASTKKGNRPSYIRAAHPEIFEPLYNLFCEELAVELQKPIQTGVFGADMQVELINDGPVTILLDSKNKE